MLSGFLSELIAVVHPSNSEYAPSGLHNLRHAATGTVNSVQYMECTDMSAPRAIRAPTCESLGAANPTDMDLLVGLQAVMAREVVKSPPPPSPPPPSPSPSPPPPPPPSPSPSPSSPLSISTPQSPKQDNDDKTGLYVAIAALGCLSVVGAASAAAAYLHMKKKVEKVTVTDGDAAKTEAKVESAAAAAPAAAPAAPPEAA